MKIKSSYCLLFFLDSVVEATEGRQRNWRRKVPVGFPDSPFAFQKMRALLSLVFAYFHALFIEGSDPATYRMFSFYCSPPSPEQNEVGYFIERQ